MPLIKSDDASGSAAKVDLNLQSVAPMQASAVSASPEVSSGAGNGVSVPPGSRQTSEVQGSSAPNVVTPSQLPPAFRGILPPPQIPTIPPPPQIQPTIPPSPIHSFPPVPPPFQPYARIFRPGSRPGSRYGVSASASATPPSTSIYGSPVPTPADGNPTSPASSPVASQASGYRHLTNQQPFHWPATHRQRKLRSAASPYSRASDPTTYMSQGPHSRFQYSSPALSTGSPASDLTAYKPRLAGTPLEISGSPGRKRADAFVAHDPFWPGTSSSQAVAGLISNDTTFDDIPTAGSPRPPFPISPHQVSRPTSAYQTPDSASHYATPLSQLALPTNERPLPPLPLENQTTLPGRISVYSAPSTGYLPLGQEPGPTIPRGSVQYSNLTEPHGSPPARPLVSYTTPHSLPGYTGLEHSYERPILPAVPSQQNVFAWQNPQAGLNGDFILNQANNPPSVWLQISRFIRLPYDLIRGLADQARPGTDDPDETEGPGKTAIFVTLPKVFYLYLLLRLPSLYFGRVARIFEEADLSLPEIKQMALETAVQGQCDFHAMERSTLSPQYERLKVTWQSFIDDVMREWQTFNLISVLLLSAILSILSHSASVNDPVLKFCALSSLICALLSLLFGCTYIIRFGSMRKTYKAAEWALEAKKTKTLIFWNVWVLLAMPLVWLTWSILLFLLCIMLFVWRAGTPRAEPFPATASDEDLLTVRLVLTLLLMLGINYGILILATFSRYGEVMDKAWKRRIDGWLEEQAALAPVPLSLPPTPFTNYTPGSHSAPYPDPRQGQIAPEKSTSPPTMSPPQPLPDPNFDRTSDPSLPSYMYYMDVGHADQIDRASDPTLQFSSDMDAGYGYTSDQKRLNAYHTQLNTMLNKSAHLKSDDTTTNLSHEDPPPPNSETMPPHEASSLTVRLVAPKPLPDSLPPIQVPPLVPNEDLSPREQEVNQNQDTPHVHFRSPLASAVEPSMTNFNPGHPDLYDGR